MSFYTLYSSQVLPAKVSACMDACDTTGGCGPTQIQLTSTIEGTAYVCVTVPLLGVLKVQYSVSWHCEVISLASASDTDCRRLAGCSRDKISVLNPASVASQCHQRCVARKLWPKLIRTLRKTQTPGQTPHLNAECSAAATSAEAVRIGSECIDVALP